MALIVGWLLYYPSASSGIAVGLWWGVLVVVLVFNLVVGYLIVANWPNLSRKQKFEGVLLLLGI